MAGLDEEYVRDIDRAVENARAEGRFDLAEYFELRATNDAVREKGVVWLFDTLGEIVEAFNSHGARIEIDKQSDHRFKFGNSRLSGSAISLRKGVRKLTLEAGWTKSTGDGIMVGGALVCARISHFGFSKQAEELLLLKIDGVPQWFSRTGERELSTFNVRSFKPHFETFLG
ncbi:MAG: hypothetical protein DWQ47_00905 [Acidobacteria bacterium]|nr:MAG: hypothetical protein DWQ32_11365 [Acidobacteriota bacterium]REK04064.1 MAG: hypothetical protein DWQ38_00890 [Acidobacteriota bacterium]REK15226.1 MAG: hypothetical protein DWQ43_17055 [Acidobacteriota bacterium]REK46316.1 MAG: hypothetical protein DWQ47_00905 [Acidobacteriota bacterium]